MFDGLFLSKNQKLVKQWKKEHEKIVVLANKVIAAYSTNNQKRAKELLKELNIIAVDHLMSEDIEFYRIQKDEKRVTPNNKEHINEFNDTFKNTKMSLMMFLTKYTKDDVELDEEFFKSFNKIVDILGRRIRYEEDNLYSILDEKK